MHDPRVSTLLARLGGVYRDPSRVDRDASSLLKSSVGAHLTPGIAPLVENNGEVAHCMVLQGTIAMHFRGQTYQLLVDLYLPPGYPHRPPVSFVRLTENMYLKENHMHVGSDGKVYLPYLHEWNLRTHNLVELVVAMSSVFSADPPVFTRAPTSGSSTSSRHNSASSASSQPPPPPPPPLPRPTSSTGSSSYTSSSAQAQREAEERLAREAEEANQAAEAARRAEREEQEREQQRAAQKEWEERKRQEVKAQVLDKISKHLNDISLQTKSQAQTYQRDQQRLHIAEDKLTHQLELYQETKESLQEKLSVVEEKTEQIEAWLEDAQNQEQTTQQQKISVDDLVRPEYKVYQQMLDLSAENASLTDALYFLDRALYLGNLDCETHLKHVRGLAKRQFLARAHLMKINQHLLKNPNLGGAPSF